MIGKPSFLTMDKRYFNYHTPERYLPSAFDESLSMLEKLNRLVHAFNHYSEITEDMLGKWNEVYAWLLGEGLDSSVGDRLREWLEDGTFDRIINEVIFGELNAKIDDLIDDFDNVKKELDDKFELLKAELNAIISKLNEEVFWLGKVTIHRGEL